jgi:hypothetical protein
MRFRFTLSHAIEGSLEINEPSGWVDAVLKLERHEDFHSLIEYFDGSFIFYGNNGTINGGLDFIKNIEQTYGLDETITIDIDLTFDEVDFTNVFNGQFKLTDLEEMVDNKMRLPIIRDDFWAKFIARLDTPVNIKDHLDLDDEFIGSTEQINAQLISQIIRQQTEMSVGTSVFYGSSAGGAVLNEYLQIDWDTIALDEIREKYNYPIAINTELPFEQFEMEFDGVYEFDIKLYFTWAGFTVDGLGNLTFTGYYNMSSNGTQLDLMFLVNGQTIATDFVQSDHTIDGNTSYSAYTFSDTLSLRKGDLVTITAKVLIGSVFFPILLGTDSTGISEAVEEVDNVGTEVPDFPNGYTDDNILSVTANTSYQQSNGESFLIHDVGGAICDRIIGENDTFYSELLGSQNTRYRQYISDGCAWAYALIKGLQLRQYTLEEKPFFMSFNQWWKGANPILNLSLAYEAVQIPELVDVSPDVNLLQDLDDWSNAPGATWDFITFGYPFVSVNGGGGVEGYAVSTITAVALTIYTFDTILNIASTGAETPNVIITWAILDSGYNEIDTISFNYTGAGNKVETFNLTPNANGAYFGVRIENNTPTETKNFSVTYAFSEAPQVVYHEETVIRVEDKASWYDDSQGTSIDFSNVRTITRKYDNDRIFNKVSIGYARWQAEDISGIDDPQTKKTYATRFQKVGKSIELYSEWIAASLAIESTRRTTREKSSDYKFDNETFIIALNPTVQDESPDTSPDVLQFIPELDENFTSVSGLLNSETRYNLKLTTARNFLRWQNFLQGALQSYLGSNFKFSSAEGNYDMISTMDVNGCLNEDYNGQALDEKGDIEVTADYLHLPQLYEVTIPMEWDEYETIRNNRKKPIGISLTDVDHVSMFIKELSYKPVKGTCEMLLWAKEYLDLSRVADTTPMQECLPSSDECENALTDSFGNILTNELGVCITE